MRDEMLEHKAVNIDQQIKVIKYGQTTQPLMSIEPCMSSPDKLSVNILSGTHI